jgi:NAD-dependent DNA ligase
MSKTLDIRTVKDRIIKLTNQINDLRYSYHVLDDPSVTDEIYDSLTQELIKLETGLSTAQTKKFSHNSRGRRRLG